MKPFRLRSTAAHAAWIAAALFGTAQAAEMTIYKQPNFAGHAMTLKGDTANLGNAGFQDQVSSVQVKSGRWQVCTQPEFKGDCTTLERGEYPTLEANLNHRIESVRELPTYAQAPRYDRDRYAQNRYDEPRYGDERNAARWHGDRDRYSRSGAVELFTGPEFRGEALALDSDADSLQSGFDQRVSSLVIHEGTWQVCSAPGFEGVCRVYEPGRYASLGRLDNRIGSLRRVG